MSELSPGQLSTGQIREGYRFGMGSNLAALSTIDCIIEGWKDSMLPVLLLRRS